MVCNYADLLTAVTHFPKRMYVSVYVDTAAEKKKKTVTDKGGSEIGKPVRSLPKAHQAHDPHGDYGKNKCNQKNKDNKRYSPDYFQKIHTSSSFEVVAVKTRISAFPGKKLLMGTLFYNPALLKDNYLISILDGGQPVGNHYTCPAD